MSLADQCRRFDEKAADFSQDVDGTDSSGAAVTIDYDRGRFPALTGYYTSISDKIKTEEAGFIDDHDSIVRIRKSVWAAAAGAGETPERKKQIKITEGQRVILLTIDEILGHHPASVEWRFGCSAWNAL